MRFGIIVYAFIPINGNVSLSIIVLLVRCYTVESVTRMNGVVCLCFWWSVVLVSQGVDLSWSCLVQCLEYMLRDLLSLPHGQAAGGIMLSFICMCAFSWRYHVELYMHVCVQPAVSYSHYHTYSPYLRWPTKKVIDTLLLTLASCNSNTLYSI